MQLTGISSFLGYNQAPAQTWINQTIMQACVANVLPNTALLQYAATKFNLNLNNIPNIPGVPSDAVKMKLLNLAHAEKTADGKMNYGPDYNFMTLNPAEMACIFRILSSYQTYELSLRPQTAIFPTIVGTLNQYFTYVSTADIVKANAIIDALAAYNDSSLEPTIDSMKSAIYKTQYHRFVSHYPAQTIENTPAMHPILGQKVVYACWATSLMQLVLHVPSLEQAILTSPNYQDARFAPFREFIQKFRASETQGNKGVCQTVSIHKITKAFEDMSGGMLENLHMQDSTEGLAFLLGELPRQASVNCLIREATHDKETSYDLDCPMIPVSVQNLLARKSNGEALLREYFFPRECGSIEFGIPLSRKFVGTPREFLINLNRGLYMDNPNPLIREPQYIKISSPISMPERLTLPGEYFVVNEGNKQYECDFFIKHDGIIPQAGHYVSYAKHNGQWWHFNDSWASPVTNEQALEAFNTSSIFHYKQV